MSATVMLIVERQFAASRQDLFRAWTRPDKMARWRGSPGWHVEADTVASELEVGGRHHHVKVRDDADAEPVVTDAVFTEFFEPDVFVAKQRITGDPQIDPDQQMELRVEFTRYGSGTLVRIVQGPYSPEAAQYHATGWESELDRLQGYLDGRGADRTRGE